MTDEAGRLAGAVTVVNDVDAEKRTRDALHDSEQRLRLAQEAAGLGVWDYDFTTGVPTWSEQTRAVFGVGPDEPASLALLLDRVHPEDRERIAARFASISAPGTETVYGTEYRVLRPDGTFLWIEDQGRLERDAAGRPLHARGIVRDITRRMGTEQALRESEARFRTLAEALPPIVWTTDAEGRPDWNSPRWSEYTGLPAVDPRSDAICDWRVALHPEDAAPVEQAWACAMADGTTFEIELRLRGHDGVWRWFLTRALPQRGPDGRVLRWLGTSTDIQDMVDARDVLARSRIELEDIVKTRTRELQETQVRLAHAQRMEALGQLAGGIAHDFNNVVQAVQGGAALIERRPGDPETVRRLAHLIAEAAGRGASITRRLLAFSRRGDLRAEAVDPLALLGGMREILKHTLGAGIDIRIEAPCDLPPLLADKGQLETVLINLATNARDAMPDGGMLTFSAALEPLPSRLRRDPDGLDPAAAAGDGLRLTVADTGLGMTPDILARVTEPFFTTKTEGKGTGLGLAMAKGFAEQSGGAFAITSAPGTGTAITLWFPVSSAPTQAATPADGVESRTGDGTLQVLLVDDDAIVREVTAAQLTAERFSVRPVESAAAALALLDAGEPFDLLITDLAMPGMDGLGLIRAAQARRPGLPAILLTGFANRAAELAVGRVLDGSFSLLRKPVTPQQLAERALVLMEGVSARRAR